MKSTFKINGKHQSFDSNFFYNKEHKVELFIEYHIKETLEHLLYCAWLLGCADFVVEFLKFQTIISFTAFIRTKFLKGRNFRLPQNNQILQKKAHLKKLVRIIHR